jgi:hypothetical protein
LDPCYFQVEAKVVAEDGGSDAASDLCGTFTAEELADAIIELLNDSRVRELLMADGKLVGRELRLTIRDTPDSDPDDDSEQNEFRNRH